MQSTIKNSHKNQQWHGWLFVHPLHDEAHWRSHKTVVEWCSLEFPQTPSYQYHTETNSLKPFFPVPHRNQFPQIPSYQYHRETVRFFTLLLHSPNSLISDKCLKSLTPVTRGFNAAKAHSFYNSTCMCVKTWPKKKKKHQKKAIIPGTLM